jgi:hypothetical protein
MIEDATGRGGALVMRFTWGLFGNMFCRHSWKGPLRRVA